MKKIAILLIPIIFCMFIYSKPILAYNLELILSSDKNTVNIGEEINVTLTLSKGMQAADFTINYDSNLLKFESSSLGKMFYNTNEPGKISCSWFDTKDTTSFTFKFIAISSGTATFTTTTENFYDGTLKSANSYNEGSLNVVLLSSTSNNLTLNNNSNNENNNNTQNTNVQNIQQVEESKNTQIINENKSTSTNIQNSTTLSSNYSSASANTNLPKTGDNKLPFIFIFLILITLAIIFKVKWNKLRDI